jgi:ATP-dependent Lon protease
MNILMTQFPLLPLRDLVVFPGQVVPLFVGRDKSVAALEAAMAGNKDILLVAQLDQGCDQPEREDLYDIGTVAQVLQLLKLPDGTVRVLVEGQQRARLTDVEERDDYALATTELIEEDKVEGTHVSAQMRSALDQFGDYAKHNKKLPDDIEAELAEIDDAGRLADAIAGALTSKVATKQSLLTETDPLKRLEMVFSLMESELSVLQVERKIRGRVKRQMEKTQREYYLNEQLKAIQSELGGGEEGEVDELAELQQKIETLKLSKEARAKASAELKKLRTMQPMSAEATVIRNYLDVLLGLPWGKRVASRRISPRRRRSSTRITMLCPRSRTESSNILPSRRVPTSSRGRSCASSARPASARPASASRSPARRGASSCANRWAACATRPRSAATAALISAHCRARSSPT